MYIRSLGDIDGYFLALCIDGINLVVHRDVAEFCVGVFYLDCAAPCIFCVMCAGSVYILCHVEILSYSSLLYTVDSFSSFNSPVRFGIQAKLT